QGQGTRPASALLDTSTIEEGRQTMAAMLLYRDEEGREVSIPLPGAGSYLGRGTDCIVRTSDPTVSRRHCRLAVFDGRWLVEDTGSANGTFVNDQRIQKEPLRYGDVLRCGALQVRFLEIPEAAVSSATAQPGPEEP